MLQYTQSLRIRPSPEDNEREVVMTIEQTRKEIENVIKERHVYGAKAILNALYDACENEPYLQVTDLIRILIHADHEKYKETRNI